MTDLRDLVYTFVAILAALPVAWWTATKRVQAELHQRLDRISGGQVATLEDLVAESLKERRLREDTPVAVYGDESLWKVLRKGRFFGAFLAEGGEGRQPTPEVAVVDANTISEERIASLAERYVLIYKEGKPFVGSLTPGAEVTFANSSITLDARLMEALRFMEARS